MQNSDKYIKASLIKFEGDHALIKIFDNQEIKWSKSKLPDNLKEGDTFYLSAQKEILSEDNNKNSAINLLEEILNGEKEKEE